MLLCKNNINELLGCIIILTINIIVSINYYTCIFNYDVMKILFINIERDWAELKCINDINILKKYSRNSYLYEKYLIWTTWIVYSSIIIINTTIDYSVYFINVVNVLNEIDYYIFMIFIDIVIIFSLIILISTDSIYITITYHVCAIFDITSYRFKHLFDDIRKMNVAYRKYLLQNRIVNIVRYHWKCIEYVLYICFFQFKLLFFFFLHYILYYNISIRYANLLDSYYSISIILQYLIVTIIFTLKFYKVYEYIKTNHIRKLIIILIDIIQNYVFVFLCFYPATKLTKHSEFLLNSAYNTCWYETPVYIQKMFKFVLQNTLKPCHLGISEIFFITFESMSKVYTHHDLM
ncbi:uncharacterized protein LOC102676542 isoform X1 [Apis dorsata]|uniref:uncharacterized protein LOC102676542 isoform X1 n=1 Tax=Apis dorsata TaxID=7462 RepID=UPI0012939955|nr:uncharacterized protein LOC102676542 isoform X1 [Apis dorsata]